MSGAAGTKKLFSLKTLGEVAIKETPQTRKSSFQVKYDAGLV